jgi:cytochrome c-type biogenesis protein CcmH
MTFWLFAAGLLALALALLLPALLRRRAAPAAAERTASVAILKEQLAQLDADLAAGTIDAAQHRAARAEIERRVLDEAGDAAPAPAGGARAPRTAIALALAVPALALALYAALGTPEAMAPEVAAAPGSGVGRDEVEAMVEQMAQRLEADAQQGADPMAWALLGRSFAALGRFDDATRAFARATALAPNDAQLLADHADVLAMRQGGRAAGEPTALIERALAADPRHPKALALAGSAAYERQDYAAAADYWRRARDQVPPDSAFAAQLDRSVADAETAAAADGTPVAKSDASPAAPAATAPATISGQVRLAPELAARLAAGDTLFVVARSAAADGPRMPLAVLRRDAAELPLAFTLDDRLAMSPGAALSTATEVLVSARISKAGQATPQPGDLVGEPARVKVGSDGVELVIDRVVP